ncbi:hypothetical protein K3495_g3376 [Podosphaera aphanis]|nr:hypothetical protein K3495_g3376 [Podosphaera aphanis]
MKLKALSEKSLQNAVFPELISYCPSMDLVALCTVDQQVSVYRLNGQRVYGRSQKDDNPRVESIQWKPNGQLFAIAWSNGAVRLISAESCKVVHEYSTGDHVAGVTCMQWCLNEANKTPSYANPFKSHKFPPSDSQKDEEFLGDLSSWNLPICLSLIDVEVSLPKLSILPRGGSSEDIFCSRSSLDAIFDPHDSTDSNIVDVMIIGTKEGRIHISIYDSFFIGSFDSPVFNEGIPAFLVLHATYNRSSTHVLLMKDPNKDDLSFVTMDLGFISSSSGCLPLLASRSTTLQNLLRYIHQTQLLMLAEWKSTQDLPERFLRNINETLSERYHCDIVQALYRSVATGHTFSPVKEWLVDELSERGLKRWEKAVMTGLENLKRIVHENMFPALERFSLILSRFSGIAKFQDSEDTAIFTNHQIDILIDSVACFHLISSRILIQVTDEIELFTSFIAWLRYESERLASDASSNSNNDILVEKESSIEHRKVLRYLQEVMTNSPLAVHFAELSTEERAFKLEGVRRNSTLFKTVDQEIKKQKQGLPYIKLVFHVTLLFENLSRQANTVFGQIAEAEKRNVQFGSGHYIGAAQPDSPMHIKLDQDDVESCLSYLTFVPKGRPNCVTIARIKLLIKNAISSIQCVESSTIQLGDGIIKDMKFSNDDSLILLWNQNGSSKIINLSYSGDGYINYAPHNPYDLVSRIVRVNNVDVLRLFSQHEVSLDENFVAERLCLRKHGQTLSKSDQRLLLLDSDGLNYKVFKYDRDVDEEGT